MPPRALRAAARSSAQSSSPESNRSSMSSSSVAPPTRSTVERTVSSPATTPAAGTPRCSKVQSRTLARPFDRRSGPLFRPAGVRALVIHERRSAQRLARLDAADEDDVIATVVDLGHPTGGVCKRETAQDRGAARLGRRLPAQIRELLVGLRREEGRHVFGTFLQEIEHEGAVYLQRGACPRCPIDRYEHERRFSREADIGLTGEALRLAVLVERRDDHDARRERARDGAKQLSANGHLAAAEIRVLSFDPVLARGAEHIEVVRVVECDRLVRHVRRDDQHLTGTHLVDLREVVPKTQPQRTFNDEGQLLRWVHVPRYCGPLLEPDLREHRLLPVEEPPLHAGHEVLARRVLPANASSFHRRRQRHPPRRAKARIPAGTDDGLSVPSSRPKKVRTCCAHSSGCVANAFTCSQPGTIQSSVPGFELAAFRSSPWCSKTVVSSVHCMKRKARSGWAATTFEGVTCEISRPRNKRDINTMPGVNQPGRFVYLVADSLTTAFPSANAESVTTGPIVGSAWTVMRRLPPPSDSPITATRARSMLARFAARSIAARMSRGSSIPSVYLVPPLSP